MVEATREAFEQEHQVGIAALQLAEQVHIWRARFYYAVGALASVVIGVAGFLLGVVWLSR